MFYAYMEEYKHNDCFFKDKTNLYNMYEKKLYKTLKYLWPVHIDMYFLKWMVFFDVFINHFLKIHRSFLCQITIDLLYFKKFLTSIYEKKLRQTYGLQGRSSISYYVFQGRSSHWEAFLENSCSAV